jgi:hypothetical protein
VLGIPHWTREPNEGRSKRAVLWNSALTETMDPLKTHNKQMSDGGNKLIGGPGRLSDEGVVLRCGRGVRYNCAFVLAPSLENSLCSLQGETWTHSAGH